MSKKHIKALLPLIIAFIAVVIAGSIILISQIKKGSEVAPEGELTNQQVAQKAVGYINDNFLQGQGEASLGERIIEEHGTIKFKVNYQGQEIDSYATKDGVLFFPQAINLDEELTQTSSNQETAPQKSCEEITKETQSLLEAFVVSQCPYGLQMQRILAEVVKNIPSLKENIEVRYIGSISGGEITAMHGTEEAQENLRQICLREETDEYWDYISCHIKKGDVNNCLTEVGINQNQLDNCMTDDSRGLKYAQEDFSLQEEHNVTGSPTLILNNEQAQESWFGGRTAEAVKTLLCCGFDNQPGVCSQKLDENQATTNYSESYSSGNAPSDGGC